MNGERCKVKVKVKVKVWFLIPEIWVARVLLTLECDDMLCCCGVRAVKVEQFCTVWVLLEGGVFYTVLSSISISSEVK